VSPRLAGRAAIVTGGGHGIGRAIALRFAAEGCALTIAGTGGERLEATARELRERGGRAQVSLTDVADETAVERMVEGTIAEFGRLDILVNNAGIAGPTAAAVDVTRDEWDRTLAINLTGALLCAKHALPHMIRQKSGRIINITSVAGFIGYPLRAAYAASKWGMIGLNRTLALEAGPHGITVNAIAPGSTRGERMSRVIRARAQALDKSEAEIEREYLDPTALKRMVSEEDVAATALFLASDEAASVTGETISVSGGFRI
jgi:NAD(P)-dependent dehydrogenase (short-subunit alcohol dehydrogenase family)